MQFGTSVAEIWTSGRDRLEFVKILPESFDGVQTFGADLTSEGGQGGQVDEWRLSEVSLVPAVSL